MEQLELRSYPRAEIAEVLSVNINDSRHFKRDVERKLSKWGYGYQYTTPAVEITSKPETPEERLSEILIRAYNIDIQISPVQFACFISAFTDIDGFESMPWAEREKMIYYYYGYSVDERTLRNWCHRLMQRGVIANVGYSTAWRTDVFRGQKIRTLIDENNHSEMDLFFKRRAELVAELYAERLECGMSPKEAKASAWGYAYRLLWQEFSCCYYYCKCFTLSAFSEDDWNVLYDIYELVQEIMFKVQQDRDEQTKVVDNYEVDELRVYSKASTKEDFFKEWGMPENCTIEDYLSKQDNPSFRFLKQ